MRECGLFSSVSTNLNANDIPLSYVPIAGKRDTMIEATYTRKSLLGLTDLEDEFFPKTISPTRD